MMVIRPLLELVFICRTCHKRHIRTISSPVFTVKYVECKGCKPIDKSRGVSKALLVETRTITAAYNENGHRL